MQKIEVLLIGLSFFGVAYGAECKIHTDDTGCENYPTLVELQKCCFNTGKTTYNVAFDSCLANFTKQGVVYPEYCASECAYRATAIDNSDKSLNLNSLEAFLKDQLKDPRYVEIVMNSASKCKEKVKQMMQKPEYNVASGLPCSPVAHLVEFCSASTAILQCPVELWQKTPYCIEVLAKTTACRSQY